MQKKIRYPTPLSVDLHKLRIGDSFPDLYFSDNEEDDVVLMDHPRDT